ncbi:MAG: hypothetical protein WCK31_02455 [bacterium]
MNIKLNNNKQLVFIIASVGLIIIAISVFILLLFSNKKETPSLTKEISTSLSASSNSVSSGPEQMPERIINFYSALPFESSEFNVDYDKTTKEVIVSSNKYVETELIPIFRNWLNRFPNLSINLLKIRYIDSTNYLVNKIRSK